MGLQPARNPYGGGCDDCGCDDYDAYGDSNDYGGGCDDYDANVRRRLRRLAEER